MKPCQIYVFRVKANKELVYSISQYRELNKMTSAVVTGTIGFLQSVKLGFLNS